MPSEKDLNINFLKREIAAAQSRIVQLDSKIDDDAKKISILQARLKLYEDRETENLHNKYFRSSSHNNFPSECADTPNLGHAPNFTSHSCCPTLRNQCCPHQSYHCTKRLPQEPTLNQDIGNSLSVIRSDLQAVRIGVDSLVKINQPNENSFKTRASSSKETNYDEAPNLSLEDDESFISVEDLIPENPNDFNDLN